MNKKNKELCLLEAKREKCNLYLSKELPSLILLAQKSKT